MDNLAHTLAGAALGEAGLKKKTGLGMATLMIAANLPDVDALGLLVGENLAWRRGWTHGPIALLLLPLLLAGAMIAFDRWQERRGKRPQARLPVRFGWLLALAYIGILSHPLLDLLNTYGVRLLMPFSHRWFYGDTLFIIDLLLWAALGLGIWRARRGGEPTSRPAMFALSTVGVYILAMMASGRAAEHIVAREAIARGLGEPRRVLASPAPFNPFRRELVVDLGDAYAFGDFTWTPLPSLRLEPPVPTNMGDPAIAAAAARNKRLADFLYWSRYPFAQVERGPSETIVTVSDGRYSQDLGGNRFTVRVRLPPAQQ